MSDDICESTGETCPVEGLIQELFLLRHQIEKMKNCANCKHIKGHKYCPMCEDAKGDLTKWELKTE